MKPEKPTACLSLEEIEKQFDPGFSYMVIENRLNAAGETDFTRIEEALDDFKSQILRQECVRDPSSGKLRLVVTMEHQETEAIMMAILGTSLKKDYHCYVY